MTRPKLIKPVTTAVDYCAVAMRYHHVEFLSVVKIEGEVVRDIPQNKAGIVERLNFSGCLMRSMNRGGVRSLALHILKDAKRVIYGNQPHAGLSPEVACA